MRLLQLFGHPHLRTGASNAPIGASPKAIALLALLAEDASRPHSRERLAETLWPDAPLDEARSNLRRHLHVLSKLLGADCFIITRSTAQWSADAPVDLDVVVFTACEHYEPERAAHVYAGDLCETIDDPALDAPRARLRMRYEALVRRAVERARTGGGTPLAGWLEQLLAFDPLDEAATRELMRVYAMRGHRTQAIRLYNGLAHRLRAELEIAPQEETRALHLSLIHADGPQRGNVPVPPRTFVGRDRELEQLQMLFLQSRVVTICGVGGVGKTTLAQRYASRRDAYFVEASGARDTDALWQRLARALDLPANADPARAICARLAEDAPLLVFDACETALSACSAVVDVLLAKTKAHLLLTSRAPVAAAGETLALQPLGVPGADVQTADALLRYPAYRLFVERSAASNAAFRVHSSDVPAIIELLRRIDGIPLAIELVAARTAAVPVHDLLASYRGSRIARLEAAISWSYRNLSPRERRMLESLAAFDGDFSGEAAAAVCGFERDRLDALLAAGLLRPQPREEAERYRLLDTIREFAKGRSGAADARPAHAAYFADLADSYARHFASPREIDYFRLSDADERNFRAAIEWSREYNRPLCARIISALCPYYVYRADLVWIDAIACELLPEFDEMILTCGIFAKGRVLRERAESQLRAARDLFAQRGDRRSEIRALHNLAITVFNHRRADALPLFEELLELQQADGDTFGAAHSLVNKAAALVCISRYDEAIALQNEGMNLFQRMGYTRGAGLALEAIARTSFSLNRLEEAYDAARAAVALLELIDDRVWLCQALRTLAAECCATKRHDEALDAIVRALKLLPQVDSPIFQCNVCFTLFDVALMRGDAAGAALAYGKAVSIQDASEVPTTGDYQEYLDRLIEDAQRIVGKTAFAALAAQGARLDYASLAARVARPESFTVSNTA